MMAAQYVLGGKDPGGPALLRPAFVLPPSVTSQEMPSSARRTRSLIKRHIARDCSCGSSVEETSRLAVIQRAQNERRCGPDAFQGFPHLRSRWGLDGGDAAIHR